MKANLSEREAGGALTS